MRGDGNAARYRKRLPVNNRKTPFIGLQPLFSGCKGAHLLAFIFISPRFFHIVDADLFN